MIKFEAALLKNNYNQGNDCDSCEHLYRCGIYGDDVGCRRYDDGLDCQFDDAIFPLCKQGDPKAEILTLEESEERYDRFLDSCVNA